MSYSTCIRSGGLCTGCMECQKPQEHESDDIYTIEEAIEYFGGWNLFRAILKNRKHVGSEELGRVKVLAEGNTIRIYWDAGVEVYTKDEVEEWDFGDFTSYLGIDEDEIEKIIIKEDKNF